MPFKKRKLGRIPLDSNPHCVVLSMPDRTKVTYDSIYRSGYKAAFQKNSIDICPYKFPHKFYANWIHGWQDAHTVIRKINRLKLAYMEEDQAKKQMIYSIREIDEDDIFLTQ